MRYLICCCLCVVSVSPGVAESPEIPIGETRLSVSSLVREDVFAGWRSNDMERFSRGEKNLDLLLEKRPQSKGEILAWKGGTRIYRAVLAHESGQHDEFEKLFQETLDLHEQARQAGPDQTVVHAVVGGSYVVFGDRLPAKHRATAWQACYDGYHKMWTQQSDFVQHMPLHIRGELLAGLIQSTQRMGRTKELNKFLDKAIEVLPDSRYATIAKRWKENPEVAANENISCVGCHGPGRLSRRMKRLAQD